MTSRQRYLLGVAIVFMSLAFWLPLWTIEIWAPQYPEGLSMKISVSSINGNVEQINILNHYIGMAKIVPAEIPELSIIPWTLGSLLVLGVAAVLGGRRFWARLWLAAFGLIAAVGFLDFYRWGYRYGHNLSPDAPIKIPDLSYQPPLLGYKKILNIEAYSLPDWGTYALTVGLLIAAAVLFGDLLLRLPRVRRSKVGTLLLSSLFLASCTSGPEPIDFHADHCAGCHMQIEDAKFAAEIVTDKGRVYKFDSVNCLHAYLEKNKLDGYKIYVADYSQPKNWIESHDAHFLMASRIPGPMGPGIVASQEMKTLEDLRQKFSGKVTDWNSLSFSAF